ncbi:MAG: epoxyqueuosine reductase QueH [Candidatus Omnitrophica bacterium]|nr:epoxyqueuosine reductase QueH [Candidatus Omnitrophota bacterium]MDD5574250.1 epoxyqueuosine reductase QueH [Candidatus Omnitrophota bacterium]
MKVLLHMCCGPCAIAPVGLLREEGFEVEGFFYNPNIHPYSEYIKRYEAVLAASERLDLNTIYHRYDFEHFLKVVSCVEDRVRQHSLCWRIRLEETARAARAHGAGAFTTTLLSSPYQDVLEITRLGREIAAAEGLEFVMRDFRKGFAQSHKLSREWELYHQNYCGCVYSEKEAIEQRAKKGLTS